MVNDQQLAKKERAIYLAWLIHLIGDIHQPHHCGTLFDSPYGKPNGDLGGNLFFVVASGKQTNLHSVWDGALGGGSDFTEINQQAGSLQVSNPAKGIALTYNPRAWSLESFNILVKKVRLNGQLKGSTKKGDGVPLPDGYTGGMAGIAMQRGATGGYHLGKTIQGLKITNVPDADENEE
jgi:hypothetical protein